MVKQKATPQGCTQATGKHACGKTVINFKTRQRSLADLTITKEETFKHGHNPLIKDSAGCKHHAARIEDYH